MNNEKEEEGYIPGVCNIGKEELKNRRNSFAFAAVIFIALIVFLLLVHAGKPWRLTVFLPAASLAIGFQQWYYKFCLAFGWKGVFNFEERGKIKRVEIEEMLKMDKKKALMMLITSILFGIIITAIIYFLP